jgi:hypothetical protein
MAMTTGTQQQREDIEALLPWHAAGTLSRRDAERVEAALANDNELQRSFELVREELGETIRLNESLGAPSARAMDRLMAGIEQEAATTPRRRASLGLGTWFGAQLSQLRPRTLAWSATAAALAIVLQAGLIAGLYVEGTNTTEKGPQVASYEPADQPLVRGLSPNTIKVVVQFTPTATVEEITRFLDGFNRANVIKGPDGGLYTLRILTSDDVDHVVKRMKDNTKIVRNAYRG